VVGASDSGIPPLALLSIFLNFLKKYPYQMKKLKSYFNIIIYVFGFSFFNLFTGGKVRIGK